MQFNAKKPDVDGETCWTQMLGYVKDLEILDGKIVFEDPPKGLDSGLDTEFNFDPDPDKPLKAFDAPFLRNADYNLSWVQNDMDATMYFMWKSKKPNSNSRWVPLRKIYWQLRSAGFIENQGQPNAKLVRDSSSFLYCSPKDEPANESPNWDRIIKTK